jgi:hypothetical protein
MIIFIDHMRQLGDKPRIVLPRKTKSLPGMIKVQAAASSRAIDARDSQAKFKATWRDGIEKKMEKEARRRNSKIFKRKGRKI